MAEVQQLIPNLLSGVSQQPATLRDNSEGDEQINGMSDFAQGLSKRMGSQHLAVISATADAAYNSVHTHLVDRNAADRYRVVLCNGDLKVFDATTGTQQTVTFPNGKAYLNTTDPAADLRCVTVGEYVYITNGSVVVAKSALKSTASKNEALVFIRSADFSTKYSVTLDSTLIEYTTSDGSTPTQRINIGTEKIATAIMALIVTALGATFSIVQYGSTLYIKKLDDSAFAISASDGLADEGIVAIKGAVQRFDSLPDRAKNGFIVEVTGDPANQFDNYFVKYDDNGSPNLAGVWRETVKPGILTSLDPSTMPHQLVRGAALFAGIVAGSIAAPPLIVFGATTTLTDNWEFRGPLNLAGILEQAVLDEEQEEVNSCLQLLDGTPATVRAWFDISTIGLHSGHFVTLELYLSNAPSVGVVAYSAGAYTLLQSRIYPSGKNLYGESLEGITSLPANTRLLLMMRYSDSVSPNPIYRAYVNLHANKTDRPTIEIVKAVGRQVRFDPNGLFPTSCITTLTVGVTPYAHTSTVDETGAQVATALRALVGAPYTATNPDAGAILVTQAGSGAPVCAVTFSFNDSTTLYNPTLNLIANQLVGQTVKDNSDGSQGTVTSNTATTIVVGALTGGAVNKFVRGDICDVVAAGTSYVFGEALWKARLVGDTVTIPFPSVVGKKIEELFFHKNRLGMAFGGSTILSQSGDSLNLFRQTATALLPDDPIDVKSTMLADFHSAIHFNDALLLWSSDTQTILGGTPLTPETISLTQITQFINSPRLRPIVLGRSVYFARAKGSATQVHEFQSMDGTGAVLDASDLTKHVPTYLLGSPIQMAGDSSLGFLAILTDADQSKLYVYTWHYVSQELVQKSWSRWEFAAGTRIVSMDCIDGKLDMLVSRPLGVYLERVDLDPSAV
jgi:hypothetical protein